MITQDVLDTFDKNHNSPAGPVGSFPSQAHLDQQLEVAEDFEGSREPLVPQVLFGPCAGVPGVGGGWDKGFVLGIRLHGPVEQRVMVQAGRVQQRSH